MSEWTAVGLHRYRVEGDVLRGVPFGEVSPDQMAVVFALLDGILAIYGYALYLVDAARSIPLPHDTRRAFLHWIRRAQPRLSTVAYNSARESLATAVLVTNAARVLGHAPVAVLTADCEADARQLLDDERARHKAALGRG